MELDISPPPAAQTTATVLRVERLTKSYQTRRVLDQVSFTLTAGERVALVGPSGCGKTTLLNCLGGVDRADSGSIQLNGVALEKLSSDELAAMRRRHVGTIFQFFHLLPTLTAFENIELPMQLLNVPARERRARGMELLERVKLTSRADALPGQLSGGEMQRVAIARALAHRPALILADEPTGNLDSVNGENILDLLAELSTELRTTMLMVTHSPDAARICHRCLHMRGRDHRPGNEGGMNELRVLPTVGLLLRRFTLRHWRSARRSTTLQILILALGIAVFFSIRLANRAAVSSFQNFTGLLTHQSDWQISAPAGELPVATLAELRAAFGDDPVEIIPVMEITATKPRAQSEEQIGSRQTFSPARAGPGRDPKPRVRE